MLSLGYHLRQSQKRAFLFFREKVLPFSGGATGARIGCGMSLFGGILVSKINVLPFSGGATGARIGCGMSLFGAFLFPK
jgi:hypothetical protein